MFEPGQRVRVVTPTHELGYVWNDDPDVVDPKYWGLTGEVLLLAWDDHGATREDPYYRVHLSLGGSAPRLPVCTTDMFWGEELEAVG